MYRLHDIQEAFWAHTTDVMQVKATETAEQKKTKADMNIALCWTIQPGGRKTKRNHISPYKHRTHTEEEEDEHTHSGSALAGALAAAAPALVLVRAKSRGRRVLPNAAVICFGNATAVSSHGPSWEMTARVGQGDSSVCSGAGTLQVMFSKALLNLMACKIR